jgi:hypothetical protein
MLLTKYYLDDKIEKNEMGGACSLYGGEKRCIQGCGRNPEERDHIQDTGINERVILRWIFRKYDVGMD